jgi:hypothetical protein
MRILVSLIASFLLVFGNSTSAVAQCAMCRATVVNNVSNGEQLGLAASLNTGIIYLFIMPYLLVALVGYLWYRSANTGSTSI